MVIKLNYDDWYSHFNNDYRNMFIEIYRNMYSYNYYDLVFVFFTKVIDKRYELEYYDKVENVLLLRCNIYKYYNILGYGHREFLKTHTKNETIKRFMYYLEEFRIGDQDQIKEYNTIMNELK